MFFGYSADMLDELQEHVESIDMANGELTYILLLLGYCRLLCSKLRFNSKFSPLRL